MNFNYQNILQEYGRDPNQFIDKEQLLRFLDPRTQAKQYDRFIFDQLYDRLEKQTNGTFTFNDFLRIVKEADTTLENKILDLEYSLKEENEKLLDFKNKYGQFQSSERLNEYGIMDGSVVNIKILEAQVYFRGMGKVFFVVAVENQKNRSTAQQRDYLYWDDSSMDLQKKYYISSGQEQIWVVATDEQLEIQRQIGGQISLNLEEFKDQQQHEEWYELKDTQNKTLTGKVRLQVQWLYSRVSYLDSLIKQKEVEIDLIQTDIQNYKLDKETIFEPLQIQNKLNLNSRIAPPQIIQDHPQLLQKRGGSLVQQKIKDAEETLSKSGYAVFLFFLSALVCSLAKCMFIDFLILFGALSYYKSATSLYSLSTIKDLSLVVFISIGFDISWLIIYEQPWWFSFGNKLTVLQLEQKIHRFTIIMVWLNLICKLIILVVYAVIYSTYPTEYELEQLYKEPEHNQSINHKSNIRSRLANSFGTQEISKII